MSEGGPAKSRGVFFRNLLDARAGKIPHRLYYLVPRPERTDTKACAGVTATITASPLRQRGELEPVSGQESGLVVVIVLVAVAVVVDVSVVLVPDS
jgi:hypothetical protein